MKKYIFIFTFFLLGFFFFPRNTYALSGNGFHIQFYDNNGNKTAYCVGDRPTCNNGHGDQRSLISRVSITYD